MDKFAKFGKIFLGQKSSHTDRSMQNLAWRRGFFVSSDIPNLVVIGGTCRRAGQKNHQIAP